MEFHALPSRIGQVRRIVVAQLRYWRLGPLIDAAVLGVTELLANVHRYAGADKHCRVELALSWGRLTVSVHDHDPRLPSVRSPANAPVTSPERTAAGGRGLALVAAVSASWGMRARRDGSGKTVWFALPAAPVASAARLAPPAAPEAGGPMRAVGPVVEPEAGPASARTSAPPLP
ncbi:ATP-binding protein [Streptomyces axinellae]|uniref:ATP-binding protein n=1 Tax=Streptomyces axinellae TaxID=552788 RepID=A0ABP6CM99_9ACTN